MDQPDIKAEFAIRLNELCDDKKLPAKYAGRQTALALQFGLSQKGARKWLEGESMPTMETSVKIAIWGECAIEWLLTGRGRKELDLSKKIGIPTDILPLVENWARLPDGWKHYLFMKSAKLRNVADRLPAFLFASFKTIPTKSNYWEFEKGLEGFLEEQASEDSKK